MTLCLKDERPERLKNMKCCERSEVLGRGRRVDVWRHVAAQSTNKIMSREGNCNDPLKLGILAFAQRSEAAPHWRQAVIREGRVVV